MNKSVYQKLDSFFSNYPTKNYSNGEIVYAPGKTPINIFNIKEGFVRSHSLDENGFELTLNIYKPSSFFPITTALASIENLYYFETLCAVSVNLAPATEVIKFIKSDNDILFDLTKRLSSGIEGIMIRTQFLIRSDARQKIASSLLMMVKRFSINNKRKIVIQLPQTHADIASIAGVSRETASVELKKLEREKVIERKGKTTIILNLLKLRKISTLYYEDNPLPYIF